MTRTLLQQALGALHPQANRAFVEATKDALRSALAAPQPEPVAYVPRCHTDGNYCIVGEYKWDEIEEKPFGLADPAHWECAALYAAPPAAPAPAVPLTREQQIAIREAHCNTASDEYFGARPQVGDVPRRRIYEAGFKEGWEIAHGIGGGGK